jgi:hypothetical protein
MHLRKFIETRTSGAKALINLVVYGTAEAVPFVLAFLGFLQDAVLDQTHSEFPAERLVASMSRMVHKMDAVQ